MKKAIAVIGIMLLISCTLIIKNVSIKDAFAEELPVVCMGEACPSRDINGQTEYGITKIDDETGMPGCCKEWSGTNRECQDSSGQ